MFVFTKTCWFYQLHIPTARTSSRKKLIQSNKAVDEYFTSFHCFFDKFIPYEFSSIPKMLPSNHCRVFFKVKMATFFGMNRSSWWSTTWKNNSCWCSCKNAIPGTMTGPLLIRQSWGTARDGSDKGNGHKKKPKTIAMMTKPNMHTYHLRI